jgi:hypothetical protein
MPVWLQNLLALSIVAAATAYVLWQGGKTLFGAGGTLGKCCSRGCDAAKPAASTTPRTVFIPADSIGVKRRTPPTSP